MRSALVLLVCAGCLSAADPSAWITDAGGVLTREEHGRGLFVDLRGSWVTDSDLTELAKLPDLRRLDLSLTRITDHGMKGLTPVPSLTDLDLSFAESITDGGLSAIKNWKHLKRLSVRGTKITDMTIQYLSALTSLESLDIGFVQVTDVGLDALTALVNLKELTVGGNKLTDAGLQQLRQLPQLTFLDLSGSQRTDSGIWAVSLTGPGVDAIATLKNLRHLRLSGTLITARGLEKLKGLKALERLDLLGCQRVSDDAVPILAGLPGLKIVDLTATAISKQGLAALHKAKPNCILITGEMDTSHRNAAEEP